MKKKLLIFLSGMATLVLLGAVYQNSFVTDPIGNPLIITTPEMVNFASKSFVTNYVISGVNPLTNFDTRTIVLSNTVTMYGKLNANKQVETPVLFVDGATTLYSGAGTGRWVGVSNNYAPLTVNLATTLHTDNSSILFGDPLGNANGANFLWNATHDDPAGGFGGEMQITAPSISISGGADSTPLSSYHIGRRIQLGIGNNYRSWIDVHFDRDGTVNTSLEGTTLPLRWQIQSSNSVSIFPAIQGRAGNTIGGSGNAYLGFYDNFDTTISGGPNYDFVGGTLRGKMMTGTGWEFYGTNVMTNVNGNLTISGSYYGDGSHLSGLGGGLQSPWTTNINGAGFSLTNAGSVQVAGAGSGHLILSETNSGGYVDMFHSGTNFYVDVASTNSAGALFTNHLTFANNVSAGLVQLVNTNNDLVFKVREDGVLYSLGSLNSALIPQIVTSNGSAASSMLMYGPNGSGHVLISAGAKGLVISGTNGIAGPLDLMFTNDVAWFPSNVVAWSFQSTSNSAVGLTTLDAAQLAMTNTPTGLGLSLTNGGANFQSNVVAANLYGNTINGNVVGSVNLAGGTLSSSVAGARIFSMDEVSIGTNGGDHILNILAHTNSVVAIDSDGTDSSSMLHIANTGAQGPFFDFHGSASRWGFGVASGGDFNVRSSAVGVDPVNGTDRMTLSTAGLLTVARVAAQALTNAIGCAFVSGSALTPGSVAQIPIPYDCTLIDLQMIAYPAGAAVLDLKDCTISGTTMTVGSSIVNAGTAPTITATANAYTDSSLTSWSTGLTHGHSLQCSVTSCTTITNLTLTMRVTHAQ